MTDHVDVGRSSCCGPAVGRQQDHRAAFADLSDDKPSGKRSHAMTDEILVLIVVATLALAVIVMLRALPER